MSATENVLTRGLQNDLDKTAVEDGKLRFTSDTGRLYLDIKNDSETKRLRISDTDDSYTEAEILAITAPLPKIYLSSDTHRALVHSGTTWVDLAAVQLSLADIADLDLPIWFSASDAEQPSYATSLTYNTSTGTLKTTKVQVGKMVIADSADTSGNHTVTFSIVGAVTNAAKLNSNFDFDNLGSEDVSTYDADTGTNIDSNGNDN